MAIKKTKKTKSYKKITNTKKSSIKTEIEKELNIKDLFDTINRTEKRLYIIYNKKKYGYFTSYYDGLIYEGERKKHPKTRDEDKKPCITIFFKKKVKDNKFDNAHLANFFYHIKTEKCITKNNIKPIDMFPLFDIFIQELKIGKFSLYDNSTLHLKYCDYKMGILGLIDKNYTYYNKFGFFPESKKAEKSDKTMKRMNIEVEKAEKSDKTKKRMNIEVEKQLLHPMIKTTSLLLKRVHQIQSMKLNKLLEILKYYHYEELDNYFIIKSKEIVYNNLNINISSRIKEIIEIYNKSNENNHYNYSYNQLLNLTIKDLVKDFILFFCNHKKDNFKYTEKVYYITRAINNFIYLNKLNKTNYNNYYNKLYYYGDGNNNKMTAFDTKTKQFIIKDCPKYKLSITKDKKTNIFNIVINDIINNDIINNDIK